MLKLVPVFALLFLISASATEQSSGVKRLREVGSIYVAEMGQTEKAKTLKQEIIKGLIASKRIKVADTADEADAVLSVSVKHGSKNVDVTSQSFGDPTLKTGSKVVPIEELVFRLNTPENRDLWAAKFDSTSFSGDDEVQAARALANKVRREFLKAFVRDSKARR